MIGPERKAPCPCGSGRKFERCCGATSAGRAADAEPLPKETSELLAKSKEALDQSYRSWLDSEIPALDGKTPRAAAEDDALRPRLAELLREMEGNLEDGLSGPGEVLDTSWVWRELGLERPASD